MKKRRGEMLNVTITDGAQRRRPRVLQGLGPQGRARARAPGRCSPARSACTAARWQLTHPAYQLVDGDLGDAATDRGPIPVYLQVKGLQNWTVAECVRIVFDHLEDVPEPLPADLRRRRGLPGRLEALRGIHVPSGLPAGAAGPAAAALRGGLGPPDRCSPSAGRGRPPSAPSRARPRAGGLLAAFDARLPFELTDGQKEVGATLAEEMARDVPMNRLLQGEVGSGKTVIALRAMLAAVDAGGQAALLAPTEVLAAQHHRSITAMLGDLAEGGMLGGSDIGTRVALLTGSQSTAARRENLLDRRPAATPASSSAPTR